MALSSVESHSNLNVQNVPDMQPRQSAQILQFPTREPIRDFVIPKTPFGLKDASQLRKELDILGYISINSSEVKHEFPFSGEWWVEDRAKVSVPAEMVDPSIITKYGGELEISTISHKKEYVLHLREGEVEIVHRYM
ncbi:MAG TPA: hypothetical protein PKA38_04020 [Candidatus Levybacteria bacterium]|nr:hypothetical protein [Candidatus Levybacteria bacterium]